MAFDAFSSLGTPAYDTTDASGDPSGYGRSGKSFSNKSAMVVAIIVIVAILFLLFGVVGLRVSGEVVI